MPETKDECDVCRCARTGSSSTLMPETKDECDVCRCARALVL